MYIDTLVGNANPQLEWEAHQPTHRASPGIAQDGWRLMVALAAVFAMVVEARHTFLKALSGAAGSFRTSQL